MAKFMNAELIAIRDSLSCNCCGTVFKGSDSQAWKVKYEKAAVYCSRQCRSTGHSKKLSKPVPLVGNCRHCKTEIYSRNKDKLYCSRVCYHSSRQFTEMIESNLEVITNHSPVKAAIRQLNLAVGNIILSKDQTLLGLRAKGSGVLFAKTYNRTGKVVHCLNCQKPKYARGSDKRKYCSHKCYIDYRAKRFERWRDNPQPLVVISDYEAFLNRDTLTCIVEGCDWSGKHLSLHVNQVHGITAEEFKKMFGFNQSTGVISKELFTRYSARSPVGVARFPELCGLEKAMESVKGAPRKPLTPQAVENAAKGRLNTTVPNPVRICTGCACSFEQSTPFGRAKYCTKTCRKEHYSKKYKYKPKIQSPH